MGIGTLAIAGIGHGSVAAQGTAESPQNDAGARFDRLLAALRADPALLEAAREDREGAQDAYDYYVSRAVAPRPKPATRKVSDRARDMIEQLEITSQRRYEQAYQHPVWPHGESGVTIGVGYDLGYVTTAFLKADWSGIAPQATIDALQAACGLRGVKAQARLTNLAAVTIPWAMAQQQFTERLLPLWIAETLNRLPNADKLSDDCLGAIVSLVYNRGGNFTSQHPNRVEMRRIRDLMIDGDIRGVPDQIRKMKRLWVGKPKMRGLIDRRELEATLFEKGLPAV